jgi:hypothetical protein
METVLKHHPTLETSERSIPDHPLDIKFALQLVFQMLSSVLRLLLPINPTQQTTSLNQNLCTPPFRLFPNGSHQPLSRNRSILCHAKNGKEIYQYEDEIEAPASDATVDVPIAATAATPAAPVTTTAVSTRFLSF